MNFFLKKKVTLGVLLLMTLVGLQSCQSDDDLISEEIGSSENKNQQDDQLIDLKTFGEDDFTKMEEYLSSQGIVIPSDSVDQALETRGIFFENLFVDAKKVTCKVPHPAGNGKYVDMSGIILVPKKNLFTSLPTRRLIVAPPPTYTSNLGAPSVLFERNSLISEDWEFNMFYFYTLQAKLGSAVLIPDYLGFGASYQQCVSPYIEVKPMVQSMISLIKQAKNRLSSEGYRLKDDMIITGYSQGGLMAGALAREIETNSSHKMSVNLLITGGTPCNLKQITDIVRSAEKPLTHSFFLPNAIWGYKNSGYPNIDVSQILLEPYASMLGSVFNGKNSNGQANKIFPKNTKELYTKAFLEYLDTDPSLAYVNDILKENSLKPWKNKCKFIMTHGVADNSVYYANAEDFAKQQKKVGSVTFIPTLGIHSTGIVPYYLEVATRSLFYK